MHKTKKQLMDTAIKLFKRDGYRNVSITDICEKCNVTKGSFYHHFENKSDILTCYYNSTHKSVIPILKEVIKLENSYDQLWMIFKHSLTQTNTIGPELIKEILLADLSSDKEIFSSQHSINIDSNEGDGYHELLISIIENGQKENQIRTDISAIDLYSTFRTALRGSAIRWTIEKGSYNRLLEVEKIFEIVFKPH